MLAINALVLRRTQTLLSENVELERRNTDLNSFAYIAGHDLREPLRGAANYLRFMREDHAGELSGEALRKLSTLDALVARSKELLDRLNHYSRVGRMEVAVRMVSLDSVLDQVVERLGLLLAECGAEIRRPAPLPELLCDPVLMREVFSNLITNALRYNVSAPKWVEIGLAEDADAGLPTIYVRDNGIGIPENRFAEIFQMFRRLHGQEEYGGGTGAGLAIVKNVIDRHGGRIWLESEPGEGTTFFFQLSS